MSETFELNWENMAITEDGEGNYEETVILPNGNYDFEVIKVEPAIYEPKPGSSLPKCGMAKVFMRIDGGELGKGLVVENIHVTPKMEWKISSFLRSIGLKKKGETVMADKLLHCDGEKGRCQIKVDTYIGRDNQQKESNKLVRFLDPPAETEAAKRKFEKGKF